MRSSSPRLVAWLGPGSEWEGDLTFEGRVRVDSRFQGRIYSEETLEIGPQGWVRGEVDVARAVVAGTLSGVIRVREHLCVEPGGLVEGVAQVEHLEVRAGGRFKARRQHRASGQPPAPPPDPASD